MTNKLVGWIDVTKTNHRPQGITRRGNFIRVTHSENVYTARLYIRNLCECSVEYVAPKDDRRPGASAVALLWHKFEQEIGKNISTDKPLNLDA